MNVTLGDDDRRAVDLLIDQRTQQTHTVQSTGDSGSNNASPPPVSFVAFGATSTSSVGERLKTAEKLFEMLDTLPAVDPPADLVKRTLRFIEEASLGATSQPPAPVSPTPSSQPLA